MGASPRKYAADRRALLTPLAVKHGLDYDREVVFPGTDKPHIAFQAVGCGADLLSGLGHADSFPAADRKAAKAGAKAMTQRFVSEEGRRASIFLAQALATWYVEMMNRTDDLPSAKVHSGLRDLVQEFFAIGQEDLDCLAEVRAEYRVMDTHDIEGRIPATGWYKALEDPEFAEGRDPHTDPELIEVQMRFASRYLRLGAERRAIEICLGAEQFDWLRERGLFHPVYVTSGSGNVLDYDLADLEWWIHIAKQWHECGARALSGGAIQIDGINA